MVVNPKLAFTPAHLRAKFGLAQRRHAMVKFQAAPRTVECRRFASWQQKLRTTSTATIRQPRSLQKLRLNSACGFDAASFRRIGSQPVLRLAAESRNSSDWYGAAASVRTEDHDLPIARGQPCRVIDGRDPAHGHVWHVRRSEKIGWLNSGDRFQVPDGRIGFGQPGQTAIQSHLGPHIVLETTHDVFSRHLGLPQRLNCPQPGSHLLEVIVSNGNTVNTKDTQDQPRSQARPPQARPLTQGENPQNQER
jgi:hypothetical protein